MPEKVKIDLKDYEWRELLKKICQKRCTPFIGPEVYAEWLPPNIDTATEWTESYGYPLVYEEFNSFYNIAREKYGYPLEDSHQLAKVAQFLAIERINDLAPKEILSEQLKDKRIPDFSLKEFADKPYAILADLNLPIYITTNYDHFMEAALKSKGKEPVSEFCRWNEKLYNYTMMEGIPSVFDANNKYEGNIELKYRPTRAPYRPSSSEPLVYHLHGIFEIPESMVLTEKDYLDFAINLNKTDEKIALPSSIRTALAGSLLFIGYRLEDISFRVVFQGVVRMQAEIPRPIGIAVQIPPVFDSTDLQKRAQEYLKSYIRNMFQMAVCGMNHDEFLRELRRRWDEFRQNTECP